MSDPWLDFIASVERSRRLQEAMRSLTPERRRAIETNTLAHNPFLRAFGFGCRKVSD